MTFLYILIVLAACYYFYTLFKNYQRVIELLEQHNVELDKKTRFLTIDNTSIFIDKIGEICFIVFITTGGHITSRIEIFDKEDKQLDMILFWQVGDAEILAKHLSSELNKLRVRHKLTSKEDIRIKLLRNN